jgi:hypothetical protein
MKIFQILGGFCHWDASNVVSTLEEAQERFAPNIVFVKAPDNVREGWGFDASLEGDARFIRPTPPDGWEYDDETGTFYDPAAVPDDPGGGSDIWDALAAAYREGVDEA